ncbi:RHS repeat domain-containing protein [Xanthomonas citri pv. malvacearum]
MKMGRLSARLRDCVRAAALGLLLVSASAVAQTTVEYIHTDALGSPVAVTNASGQVVERTFYEPYGAQVDGTPDDGPGFTGHVEDAATGLIYMQQRYYDPAIPRFLSVDPIAASLNTGAGFNRYAYVLNNPYRFTDPDGRCEKVTGSNICGGSGVARAMLATSVRSPLDIGGNSQSGVPRRAPPLNSVARDEYNGSSSSGEKKQVLQLVGPFDALKAKSMANKALSDARNSGLPGLHNGSADAYRHCTWSCDMSRSIGVKKAQLVGDNHEAWGGNPSGETKMDLFNNRSGREYSAMSGSCSSLCMQGVRDEALMLNPEE